MKTAVSSIHCTTYDSPAVMAAVQRAVDLLGGISAFVKPGERILLKPNLLSAKEPERHITTHPEVVRAIVRLVRSAGAIPVIGDSPGGAVKGVDRVWEKTGMKRIAAEEKVELVNFETAGSTIIPISHPLLDKVCISNAVLNIDGIINLPKFKTHALMLYTGAVKNFYGCVPGLRKAEYHKEVPHPADFGHLLAEIFLIVKSKVRFTLMDGIIGMEGNGPSSGDIRPVGLILASSDAVALDTVATSLLGFNPEKMEFLTCLGSKKGGVNHLSDIEVRGDSKAPFSLAGFKKPENWYLYLVPRFLINFVGKLVWMKPVINTEKCTSCMMCVNSCPVKTIHAQKGSVPVIDWKGCISCLCCHELCPYAAIDLKSSAVARLLIRH